MLSHGNGDVLDAIYPRTTTPHLTLAGVRKRQSHGLWLAFRLIPVVRLVEKTGLGSARIAAR